MLRRGALAPTAYYHHVKVGHDRALSRERMFHSIRQNPFDKQEFAFLCDSTTTVLEDCKRTLVIK
jgi:hypothetical protein